MAVATFKDLCIDAADAARLGTFWAAVLDREWHAQDDGDGYLTGPTPQHTVWVNAVAEPKTVKHRVHFDIYTSSIDDLVTLGATAGASFAHWTVMTDPEGGEFDAFVRDEVPAERLHGLAVDARDADAIAAWWADVYGARLTVNEPDDQDRFVTLDQVPGMPIATMDFAAVPEPKTVKNRIHWDVVGETQELLDRGATLLRRRDEQIGWDVLADPEGNEFCVFAEA